MIFLVSLLTFFPRLVLGFCISHFIWNTIEKKYLLVKIFLAGAIGFGITSLIAFLWIWLGLSLFSYVIVELSITILIVIYTAYKYLKLVNIKKLLVFYKEKNLTVTFFILIVIGLFFSFNLILQALLQPHGGFDAWFNWNVVSRFIYRGEANWHNTFLRVFGHPDYPFFIPMTNALTWVYLQKDTFFGPIALHFIFSFFMVGLLFSLINALKGFQQAFLVTILFIAQPIAASSMGQFADYPFAYILLAIGGITFLYYQTRQEQLAILAGFLTGLAAWIKNEGFVTIIISMLIWFFITFANYKTDGKNYFLGLAFPVTVIILFKVFLAPPNDLIAGAQNIIGNLLDISRYFYILKTAMTSFWDIGGASISLVGLLLLYILIVGKTRHNISGIWILGSLVFCQLFIYFIIYLLTPHDLIWHIKTSISRLLLHVLPLSLLLIFIWLKDPQELSFRKAGH